MTDAKIWMLTRQELREELTRRLDNELGLNPLEQAYVMQYLANMLLIDGLSYDSSSNINK